MHVASPGFQGAKATNGPAVSPGPPEPEPPAYSDVKPPDNEGVDDDDTDTDEDVLPEDLDETPCTPTNQPAFLTGRYHHPSILHCGHLERCV